MTPMQAQARNNCFVVPIAARNLTHGVGKSAGVIANQGAESPLAGLISRCFKVSHGVLHC
ncbi:Unknown protein sequence [Pseudomonas syringae pv. aceris]|nr:Unknown protein sequence [Pseudomonas syringae pv. aceris]